MLPALLTALLSATAIAAALPAPPEWCVSRCVLSLEQEHIWNAFFKDFYITKNVSDSFHRYVTADYIQHNPYSGQGPEDSIEFVTPIQESPYVSIEVLHTSFSNGYGWIHTRYNDYTARPTAVVDIFRFNGSCIQEHWDVIEELPADATNPIAFFR